MNENDNDLDKAAGYEEPIPVIDPIDPNDWQEERAERDEEIKSAE
jgi:hypothetical protein